MAKTSQEDCRLADRARGKITQLATGLAIAGVILAVPGSIVSLLDLHQRVATLAAASLLFAATLLVAALIIALARAWRRVVAPALSRRRALSNRVAHRDQGKAKKTALYYSQRVATEPAMLAISVAKFAKQVRVKKRFAKAILENPDIIARSDLWPSMEKALMLPDGFFERGRARDNTKYGAYTEARIRHYIDNKLVRVNLKNTGTLKRNARTHGSLLAKIERQRLEELGLEGRTH